MSTNCMGPNRVTYRAYVNFLYKNLNHVIIDVRTEEDYKYKRIVGSVWIPIYDMMREAERLYAKDMIIFLYCETGAKSKVASTLLVSMGYTQVYDLGAIQNWRGEFERI